jgi:hypothetical protein
MSIARRMLTQSTVHKVKKGQGEWRAASHVNTGGSRPFTHCSRSTCVCVCVSNCAQTVSMPDARSACGARSFVPACMRACVCTCADKKYAFVDVVGCDEAKEEVAQVVDFLQSPDKYAKLGATVPR